MIKEAVSRLGGQATYSELKDYLRLHYGEINDSTANCQIIFSTVNHHSRVHCPRIKKPGIADTQYDFLYTTAPGKVELYDPEKHGIWEIREDKSGSLTVGKVETEGDN
jgi:predicted secreted Zn-dependent protease